MITKLYKENLSDTEKHNKVTLRTVGHWYDESRQSVINWCKQRSLAAIIGH